MCDLIDHYEDNFFQNLRRLNFLAFLFGTSIIISKSCSRFLLPYISEKTMVATSGRRPGNQHSKNRMVEDHSSLSSSSSPSLPSLSLSSSSKSSSSTEVFDERKCLEDDASHDAKLSIIQRRDEDDLLQPESCYQNESTQAHFTYRAIKFPFAEGGYRYAAKGEYIEGPRKGQKCVAKWPKKKVKKDTKAKKTASSGDRNSCKKIASKIPSFCTSVSVDDDDSTNHHPFERDIRVSRKASEIVHEFNELEVFSRPVQVTIPEVWKFDSQAKNGLGGVMYIQEPFIRGFHKFNCSSGWVDPSGTSCSLAIQALSHFSYHISGGRFLLNDIQGGEYPKCVIITDPVIHTGDDSDFADGDLGPDGINSFFRTHKCNRFCDKSWLKKSRVRPKYTNLGLEGVRNSDLQPLAAPKGDNALIRGRVATGGTVGYKVVVGESSVAKPSFATTDDSSISRSMDKAKPKAFPVQKKTKTTATNYHGKKSKRARTTCY